MDGKKAYREGEHIHEISLPIEQIAEVMERKRLAAIGAAVESAEMIERLAALAHDGIWSTWMAYLFSKCTHNADGSMTIPTGYVERWFMQSATPYAELPKEMKWSDREQAEKMLRVLRGENWETGEKLP